MRSDVLLEVTGLLESSLTEATLVGSVHTARLPQVLVKQVVSRGLLYQTYRTTRFINITQKL